jgi:hypothetical protein
MAFIISTSLKMNWFVSKEHSFLKSHLAYPVWRRWIVSFETIRKFLTNIKLKEINKSILKEKGR